MKWHVPDVNKRLIVKLKVDLSNPTFPSEQVIERGQWTFTVYDLIPKKR